MGGLSKALENRFSKIRMWLLGTDCTDFQIKLERVLKNLLMVAAFGIDFTDLR